MSELARARADAALKRQRLMDTAQAVRVRLSPAVIANHAVEGAKRKGEAIAEDAVEAVKRRPVAAASAAAGAAALLGFGLFTRFRKHPDDEGDEK